MALPIPNIEDDEEAQEILRGSEPIDPGIYDAVVEAVEETSVQKEGDYQGAPMLKLTFRITQEPYNNRKAWRSYIFKGKPFGFAVTALGNLGVPQEQLSGSDFDSTVLINRACRVSIGMPKGSIPGDGSLHEVKSVLKASAAQNSTSTMP